MENAVEINNKVQRDALEDVRMRINAMETDLAQVKNDLENRIAQFESKACPGTCSQSNELEIKRLSAKLETLDRANRKNNISIMGLSIPLSDMKGKTKKYLTENCKYSELNKNGSTNKGAVTLESWEDKMHILKHRKQSANSGGVFIQPDRTDKERNCVFKLRQFTRIIQRNRKGIMYDHHKVCVNNHWYKWDKHTDSITACPVSPKPRGSSSANSHSYTRPPCPNILKSTKRSVLHEKPRPFFPSSNH